MLQHSQIILRFLLVTVATVSLLCGTSCSVEKLWRRHQERALDIKVTSLKHNLVKMRWAIQVYTKERNYAPQTLNDLVQSGFLPVIPSDPFTDSTNTWQIEKESSSPSDGLNPGIKNVRSGAVGLSPDGIPYSQY